MGNTFKDFQILKRSPVNRGHFIFFISLPKATLADILLIAPIGTQWHVFYLPLYFKYIWYFALKKTLALILRSHMTSGREQDASPICQPIGALLPTETNRSPPAI
jgi:hypothetical protein